MPKRLLVIMHVQWKFVDKMAKQANTHKKTQPNEKVENETK